MRSSHELARCSVRYWGRYAPGFDGVYSNRRPLSLRLWNRVMRRSIPFRRDLALAALAPLGGRRVIDVGCGSGRVAVELAGRGAEVVGVDLSPEMLSLAAQLAEERGVADRCTFHEGDVTAELPAGPFGGAVVLGVFDYLEHPLGMLRRLGEAVDGPIVASFPDHRAFRVPFRWLWHTAHRNPVHFWGERALRSLLQQARLTPTRVVRRHGLFVVVAEGSRA